MNNSAKNLIDFPRRMLALDAEFNAKVGYFWSMVVPKPEPPPAGDEMSSPGDDVDYDNPYAMGAYRSFIPVLGEVTWELPTALAGNLPFYAYTCQVSGGRSIGYVRVPHYSFDQDAVDVFAELVARFESRTEAMVLDQVNNPGGDMFRMYAVLSTLTDRPLVLPTHELALDENDAALASENVAKAEGGEAVPPDERPSPEVLAYSRFVLSEIEAGRKRLTNPVHLGGVTEILPADSHYTKKIFVLINALDFSAPEFLAAILQDNKRATLFGESTAGAGGCVRQAKFPTNQLGLDYFTYTWTIARRPNGRRIESIGVQPDVTYSLTAEDLQSGFTGYRRALLATINA